MQIFNITWADPMFNEQDRASMKRRGVMSGEDVKSHLYTFRAYDDDGILYFKGTCNDDWEYVMDWTMADSGCTQVKFYDRKTGKYLDEIS